MSSAYYELYLKGVLDLVGTMVVKSEVSAQAINNRLRAMLYTVDDLAPATWKYYLNLAGKYHHSDTPMTVKSLDTREEIPFTVEALDIHRTTKREYTYRSRYYNELVERYPNQVELILGILNPVDMSTAIAADDHTILYYDTSLVESNEIDLIPRLQTWIYALYNRWNVPDYNVTESLFPAGQLAMMFAFMPKQILNIRLDNCKTDKAHSFHIRQYLTSFGRLDPYFDYMSRKLQLFLYRNIRYLNLNAGKQETFETLTEKVLTDRYFPLAEYTLRHNSETQSEDLYPSVQLRRQSLNGLSSALGADIKTVSQVLDLEQSLARRNSDVQSEATLEITQAMKNSLSSELKTKVLESNVLDKTDAEPFTLSEVTFNHWIYLASIGRYNSVFTVTSPSTGEDLYLTAKEMFILWLYAYNKARGVRMEVVPNITANRVKRIPGPTIEELRGIVNERYVDDRYLKIALSDQPAITSYVSVDAFKELCVKLHRASLRHRDLTVYQDHYLTRGQLEQMTDRFYMDYRCNLADEIPYDDWLAARALNLEAMSESELDLLASSVYSQATGQDLTAAKSLQDIHTAHLRLMSQLSSYSIQFIQQINTSALKIEDWVYVRMGDQESKGFDGARVLVPISTTQDMTARGKPAYFPDRATIGMVDQVLYTRDQLYRDIRLNTELLAAGNGYVKERLAVIENRILETAPIDLATVVPNDTPVGYSPIEYQDISDMFETTTSALHAALTTREQGILLART